MNKEEIEILKKMYQERYNKRTDLIIKLNEYGQLLNDPNVKRYIELSNILSEYNYEKINDDQYMVSNILKDIYIEEPSNIYVFMGLYTIDSYIKYVYRNIENSVEYYIDKDQKEQFENDNIIIKINDEMITESKFERLQYDYLKDILLYSQIVAKDNLNSKNKSK